MKQALSDLVPAEVKAWLKVAVRLRPLPVKLDAGTVASTVPPPQLLEFPLSTRSIDWPELNEQVWLHVTVAVNPTAVPAVEGFDPVRVSVVVVLIASVNVVVATEPEEPVAVTS